MRLAGAGLNALTLRVTGYQFPPDDPNPRRRLSWHEVEGAATISRRSWSFDFPALTCHESPFISRWLRHVRAHLLDPDAAVLPPGLRFTEPNVRFGVVAVIDGLAVVRVSLDQEFLPPWRATELGRPTRFTIRLGPEQLVAAADEWDDEIAPFPHDTDPDEEWEAFLEWWKDKPPRKPAGW